MYEEMSGTVLDIVYEDDDVQLIDISCGSGKGIVYLAFIPAVDRGDEVIVNTTALTLHLGTGGLDMVVRVSRKNEPITKHSKGHIMKARYLPSQHSVLTVEEEESCYHEQFLQPTSLHGQPVLLGELHSMIAPVYYTLRYIKPNGTLTVIVSDQAALPLSVSYLVRHLKAKGGLETITIGQGFGGDWEAVNLYTALQCAVDIICSDAVLITLGPGSVGTGTVWGFSGMAMAEWANAVYGMDGQPIWIPRLTFQDQRKRHHGISHHTIAALQFSFACNTIVFPQLKDRHLKDLLKQRDKLFQRENDTVKDVDVSNFFPHIMEQLIKDGYVAETMGRNVARDPLFYAACVAAACYALERS